MIRLTIAGFLLLILSGCSALSLEGKERSDGYQLPLMVNLWLDPSVTQAGLGYRDACFEPRSLSVGHRLSDALIHELSKVFAHVQVESVPEKIGSVDGVVEVELGLQQLDLIIPDQQGGTYPAAVQLGATISYFDSAGVMLYSKKLRTEADGDVQTDPPDCTVQGLQPIANKAVDNLAVGLKTHLGSSSRVRAAAKPGAQSGQQVTASTQAPPQTRTVVPVPTPPQAAPGLATGSADLSFRVMLTDANRNQVLEGGEHVTVVVEVMNAGPDAAQGVQVMLSGAPAQLIRQFTTPMPVGDLQPGETKRVQVSGRTPPVSEVQNAELLISLDSRVTNIGQPPAKKFIAAMRPGRTEELVVLSVDVDQIPQRVHGYQRKDAVAIVVGVGTFRDPEIPGVRFAAHDAEIVSKYFQTVGGIPPKQIRTLTDNQAHKGDLVEVLEEWIPKRGAATQTVFLYFSGRAQVDGTTGSISLFPYEGRPTSARHLISMQELRDIIAKLPAKRVVLFFDVSLEPSPGLGSSHSKAPSWNTVGPDLANGKFVQIVGSRDIQEAHQYEEGQHGLFTYHLLKGLRGAADGNKNGVVTTGELCHYVSEQVSAAAQKHYGTRQEPACVPPIDPKAEMESFPVTRVK